MRNVKRALAAALVLTAASGVLVACGGSNGPAAGAGGAKATITPYNAQHDDLMKLMGAGFTAQTGIKVEMRSGEDPELANQIAAAGADFQAIVSAVLAIKGEAATAAWLKGLKANAKVYQGNGAAMKAVNAGEIQGAIIYHYYWYQDRAEAGSNSANVGLHFFGNKDPGAFAGVSGAGVLKSSKHQAEAQQLVRYLTGQAGQTVLADSNALEYSVSAQVTTNPALKPMSDLDPPVIDISALNGPKVVELMQQAGVL